MPTELKFVPVQHAKSTFLNSSDHDTPSRRLKPTLLIWPGASAAASAAAPPAAAAAASALKLLIQESYDAKRAEHDLNRKTPRSYLKASKLTRNCIIPGGGGAAPETRKCASTKYARMQAGLSERKHAAKTCG